MDRQSVGWVSWGAWATWLVLCRDLNKGYVSESTPFAPSRKASLSSSPSPSHPHPHSHRHPHPCPTSVHAPRLTRNTPGLPCAESALGHKQPVAVACSMVGPCPQGCMGPGRHFGQGPENVARQRLTPSTHQEGPRPAHAENPASWKPVLFFSWLFEKNLAIAQP